MKAAVRQSSSKLGFALTLHFTCRVNETRSNTMENTRFKHSQYACAVLLIVSSIALVAYQVVQIDDVASGLLYYVAQSFLLAGSIFGLDQYVRNIKKRYQSEKE